MSSSSSPIPTGLQPNSHSPASVGVSLSSSGVLVRDLQLLLLPFKTASCSLSRGRHCETFVDVCPQMPCLNGGTCAVASNTPDGFICRCPPVSCLPVCGTSTPSPVQLVAEMR